MNRQAVAERQLVGESDKAIDCLEKSITHGWGQRESMGHDPTSHRCVNILAFRALMEAPRT